LSIAIDGLCCYSFAWLDCFAFASSTIFQPILANGTRSSPYCFAFSLLACLTAYLEDKTISALCHNRLQNKAYLAAIPWKMILSRNSAKEAAHVSSLSGISNPAVSQYHCTASSRDGSPGKSLLVESDRLGCTKARSAWMRGQSGVALAAMSG
jgi:hypothetical protein